MKRTVLSLCVCALCLSLCGMATAQEKSPVTPNKSDSAATTGTTDTPGQELVQLMLSLYRAPDFNTRQQAYLVSAGLPAYPKIVRFLREQKKKSDAAEQAVINYALAAITRTPEDIAVFLKDFPLDEDTYNAAFYPHGDLERLVVQIQFFLRELAYEPEYAERAKYLFWVALYHPDFVHSVAPHDDPLLKEYRDKHEYEDFALKPSKKGVPLPREVLLKLMQLVKSKDVNTRVGAAGMVWFFDDGHKDVDKTDFCKHIAKYAATKAEGILLSDAVCSLMDTTFEITAAQDLENALTLRHKTYRNPDLSIVRHTSNWATAADCPRKPGLCESLKVSNFEGKFLNTFEKIELQRYITTMTTPEAAQ